MPDSPRSPEVTLTDAAMQIVKHCAQECEYQRSGEMSVYWMLDAWMWALAHADTLPDVAACKRLGQLIEPRKNRNGFRVVAVWVGSQRMPPFGQVPHMLDNLFEIAIHSDAPAGFFREFEEIHPFVDGNGRTGNILYNWLNGTLSDPLMPPDFWNQDRIEGRV